MSTRPQEPPVQEIRTVEAMIRLYCRGNHRERRVCYDCAGPLDYARRRLEACPYGADKPACSKCPVHCYMPGMRDRIRHVMRYSGPRMFVHHPLLALAHRLRALGRRSVAPSRRRAAKP